MPTGGVAFFISMKFLKANATSPKLKTFEGVKYLVVPIVMAIKDVEMNGAIIREGEFHAESWNGVAVTLSHPEDYNGNAISANSPDVLEKYRVGQIFNTKFEDGKLKAEAWVNVDKANKIDPKLIERLQSMDSMDVSTGYFSEVIDNEYKNIKPDHLALLPNEQGACSFDDGCGVRSNSKTINELFANKEIPEEARIRLNEKGFYQIAEDIRALINDDTSFNEYAWVEDVYDDYFIYVIDGEGELKYYKRSYSVSEDGEVMIGDQTKEVAKEITYKPTTNGANMIDELIANDASPFTENDRAFLEAKSEEAVKSLNEKYKESAPEPEKPEVNSDSVLSAEDKEVLELARQAREEKIEEYTTHILANSQMTKCDLKGFSVNQLKSIASGIKPAPDYSGRGFGKPVTNGATDEDELAAMSTPSTIAVNTKEVN